MGDPITDIPLPEGAYEALENAVKYTDCILGTATSEYAAVVSWIAADALEARGLAMITNRIFIKATDKGRALYLWLRDTGAARSLHWGREGLRKRLIRYS